MITKIAQKRGENYLWERGHLFRHEGAERKALALFLTHLTRQEKLRFLTNPSQIEVTGSNGRTYILVAKYVHNVGTKSWSNGLVWYCGLPWPNNQNLPLYDVLLAQKLLIETDASAFHRIAHPLNGPH